MKFIKLLLILLIFSSPLLAQVGNTDENPCPAGSYLFYSKVFDNVTNLWNSPICAQGNGKLLFQNALIGPAGITFSDGSKINTYNPSTVPVTTVSNLNSFTTQRLAVVTDGTSSSDCTIGVGTFTVTCQYNGATWSSVASAGMWPATVIDNGGQVFNVKSFGAVCNGVTDDMTAIQNAINAASAVNGVALIPSSSLGCVVSDFIVMKSNMTLSGYGKATIKFTGNGDGVCSDAQNPVNTGFIRWAAGGNRITGLNIVETQFSAGTCVLNLQDGTETSGVEIDHNNIGSNNTGDTNIGIYSYSNDTINIHDNVFKYIGQPIFGGAHTWAKITIGPNNVFWGQVTTKYMIQTPAGANCFSVNISHNVFEGFYSTNGITGSCTNGEVIESNYFGDSSATGGNWIGENSATLIGNYIDGSGQMASGGYAINGSFTAAIGNYIYGKSFIPVGGTLIGNTFLSGPSAGCFITMNQSAAVVSTGNSFTTSGGAANSFCHANSLTPHPIVISTSDTDSTTNKIQSGVTVKFNGKTPNTFSTLPTCSADIEGNTFSVIDSNTNIASATIAGGGTDHVLAVCLPTGGVYNWIVGIPHA